jgi:hypothetical protein
MLTDFVKLMHMHLAFLLLTDAGGDTLDCGEGSLNMRHVY